MKITLANLNIDDKFTWEGKRYVLVSRESNMCEVFCNGRFWAWPSSAQVNHIR